MESLEYKYNDGGREKYFTAKAGDCVTRALAIVTNRDYKEVYDEIACIVGYSPRNGITNKDTKKVVEHYGGKWIPKMGIGTGCNCHLAKNEIPMNGRLICSLSGHLAAVIDGIINDTHDCSRNGTRCVYGYWIFS